MKIEITLQVEAALAKELSKPKSDKARRITEAVAALGATLRPLHPGVDDETLGSYFLVALPRGSDTNKALSTLRALSGVTAAYLKPAASPA